MIASLDANILVYALNDEADERQVQASNLIATMAQSYDVFLTLQSLAEFSNVLRRKKIAASTIAAKTARLRAAFVVAPAVPDDLDNALWAVEQHNLAFWDAMLWATCRRAGATVLFTEDFQDGRTLKGLRFVNPFLAKNAKYLPKA